MSNNLDPVDIAVIIVDKRALKHFLLQLGFHLDEGLLLIIFNFLALEHLLIELDLVSLTDLFFILVNS
jgi:hypothetical protein